ncbi:hypothetical protein ACJX0J_028737 [Zea mays]
MHRISHYNLYIPISMPERRASNNELQDIFVSQTLFSLHLFALFFLLLFAVFSIAICSKAQGRLRYMVSIALHALNHVIDRFIDDWEDRRLITHGPMYIDTILNNAQYSSFVDVVMSELEKVGVQQIKLEVNLLGEKYLLKAHQNDDVAQIRAATGGFLPTKVVYMGHHQFLLPTPSEDGNHLPYWIAGQLQE